MVGRDCITICCSSSPPTRRPWRRRVDSAFLSDRRSRKRSDIHLQLLRVPMPLRRRLVLPADDASAADSALPRRARHRAARSAPSRRSLKRKRLQTQSLRKAACLLLRLELLGLWISEQTGAAPRVNARKRRSAARRARRPCGAAAADPDSRICPPIPPQALAARSIAACCGELD
eukprot:663431-Prymnesium_polylepis.1